jgi:SAM-dependent methyltransferase
MDEEGLEPSEHLHALKALAMVNRLSLTAGRIWREVLRQERARRQAGGVEALYNGPPPLRLLDVACGGGDVTRALKRRALRECFPLEVHGCDVSPLAVAHAEGRAREEGLDVNFFQLDALGAAIPGGFDLICSSLFIHHLTDDEVVSLLSRMAEAGRALLLQDLVRSRSGWWLSKITLNVLSRSQVAQVDGPRSVQASYRIPEIASLARRAGLAGAEVRSSWPQRFTLSWSRA